MNNPTSSDEHAFRRRQVLTAGLSELELALPPQQLHAQKALYPHRPVCLVAPLQDQHALHHGTTAMSA